jgi:hypothetical protein
MDIDEDMDIWFGFCSLGWTVVSGEEMNPYFIERISREENKLTKKEPVKTFKERGEKPSPSNPPRLPTRFSVSNFTNTATRSKKMERKEQTKKET